MSFTDDIGDPAAILGFWAMGFAVLGWPLQSRGSGCKHQRVSPEIWMQSRLPRGQGGVLDLEKQRKKPFLAAVCQLERFSLPEQLRS